MFSCMSFHNYVPLLRKAHFNNQCNQSLWTLLSRATSLGAPSYGGVRTWVEGSQTRRDRALAGASNLLGYKELSTNNAKYTTD